MYIFEDINKNCRKLRFIKEQRRLLKNFKQKILYLNFRDFINIKHIR